MYRPFRFGLVIANAPSPTAFTALARRAEELGYATLLMPDRTNTGLAPLIALAIAAEVTTSLRVGSYMFCNDYRHPALLSKEVATLDFLSGGRFELGLGAGVGPLELAQLSYVLTIVDNLVDRNFEGEGPPIALFVMSASQAVEHLLEQRERYGFSYIPVYGGVQMEKFAPVVAQLASK